MSILESSQCNEGCQAWPRKTKLQYKNKMYNLKDLYKNAKLNDNKRGAAPQMSPFFDVFDEVSSSRDVVDIPEKKKVGYVRQTSEQETISLDGASSFLKNVPDSSRSSDGKM